MPKITPNIAKTALLVVATKLETLSQKISTKGFMPFSKKPLIKHFIIFSLPFCVLFRLIFVALLKMLKAK